MPCGTAWLARTTMDPFRRSFDGSLGCRGRQSTWAPEPANGMFIPRRSSWSCQSDPASRVMDVAREFPHVRFSGIDIGMSLLADRLTRLTELSSSVCSAYPDSAPPPECLV